MLKERYKADKYSIDVRRTAKPPHKKVVVMLHGIGVSGTYLLPLGSVLSRTYDVRILDLPGYGTTPKPDHALSPVELADIAADYLIQENITGAIIIGQSMGCQTAAYLAVRHPRLCKKLLLVGPTVNREERTLLWQGWRLLQDSVAEPAKVNAIIVHDYLQMGVARFFKTTQYMLADHLEKTLPRVNQPVCIIRGANDHIVPKKWVEHLEKVTKNTKVYHVAGGPHNVQFSKPNEVFAICKNFLET